MNAESLARAKAWLLGVEPRRYRRAPARQRLIVYAPGGPRPGVLVESQSVHLSEAEFAASAQSPRVYGS